MLLGAAGAAWAGGVPTASATLSLLNALDSTDNDISYYYDSQLANEGAPVTDVHLHPVEPRTLRIGVQARF